MSREIKVGDKIASDDYSAIGVLVERGDQLYVVGDFGETPYDAYSGDWEHHDVWLAEVKRKRAERGGFFRLLFNSI